MNIAAIVLLGMITFVGGIHIGHITVNKYDTGYNLWLLTAFVVLFFTACGVAFA